jgi:hypothetical protein
MPSAAPTATKGPRPEEVIRRIGDTNEQAIRYVLSPDPKLSRLSRKVREALLPDLPPVTAGALLGPAALARHFIASASAGRYRDLFALWELFRQRPDECKPELADRQQALDKARGRLATALKLGLAGHAERVAEDVARAEGLIWQWVREVVTADLALVGRRPAVASELLRREPGLHIPLPAQPDDRWLDEAAAARRHGPLAPPVDALLAANADRLPATIATLAMAQEHYPERVQPLLDHVDLESPEIGAILAWSRDHGYGERLRERVRARLDEAAASSRAEGLAVWYVWRERGVELKLPASLRAHTLDGLDITRPETGMLLAALQAEGADLAPQEALDDLAARNRMLAEKAYESFVCAGLDVQLPAALHDNPHVRVETPCPACQAWTWVRPGHEKRCPRLAAMPAPSATPADEAVASSVADDWTAAAAAQRPPAPEQQPAAPAARAADVLPAGAPAGEAPGHPPGAEPPAVDPPPAAPGAQDSVEEARASQAAWDPVPAPPPPVAPSEDAERAAGGERQG